MTAERIKECLALTGAAIALAFVVTCGIGAALARDNGQWESQPPELRAWFSGLMQPNNPQASCCGESDAYWADSFEIKGDQYVAIVTDERTIPGRPHIAPGTRIVIPNNKIKFNKGNPTGHGIVFVSQYGTVYRYLPPGGV